MHQPEYKDVVSHLSLRLTLLGRRKVLAILAKTLHGITSLLVLVCAPIYQLPEGTGEGTLKDAHSTW